jgi:hypothetical protein
LEAQNKQVDLEEWESLFRHPNFSKVEEVLTQRIESIQNGVRNCAKNRMNLNAAVESAGDLRVIAEMDKILLLFKNLKMQILQQKGAR